MYIYKEQVYIQTSFNNKEQVYNKQTFVIYKEQVYIQTITFVYL